MTAVNTAVIGGGAAGLWAGCLLRDRNAGFIVLERGNECGRKLLLTGHGRCNITNNKSPSELRGCYHEAGNFVYPALCGFTPSDACEFISGKLGVPLKTEENDRVFPVSDKASDIRDAMVRFIGSDHIKTGFECVKIERSEDGFNITPKDGDTVSAKHVILACGGAGYPRTGSDGSGFELASSLGHTIAEPKAALAAINTCGDFCRELSGVSVDGVSLSLFCGGRKTASASGTVLFTHQGISGPAAMELSREIPSDPGSDTYIEADFVPSLTDKILADEISGKNSHKFVNLLAERMPRSLAAAIVCDDELYCRDVRSEMRKAVVKKIKMFRFDVTEAPSTATAYVTRGGVILKELNRSSYESKLVKGLHIIGENTDVDGISGGFNLAFAASSAFLAVKDILS